ncbi:hypothetical protein RI367_007419 [Sorochytrium milnesiophthora]
MASTQSLRLLPDASSSKTPTHALSTDRTTHSQYLVHDSLRHGVASASVKARVSGSQHPMEVVVENYDKTQFETKLAMHRNVYGLHAPIRLQMERALVSQVQRLPVLPSSNLALEILSGKDTSIDVEDFLGDVHDYTDTLDLHAAMERKLKINV